MGVGQDITLLKHMPAERMIDSRGSRKARIQWSRVIGVAVSILFAAEVALAFERKLVLSHQIGMRLRQTQADMERLQRENIDLKKEKEALYHPEKIEQLARERLGLTKPDEIAIQIVKKNPAQAPAPQGEPIVHPKTLWEKIKEELPLSWLSKSGRS